MLHPAPDGRDAVASDPSPPRPARSRWRYFFAFPLVAPPVSPHVYLETDRGEIEIELFVLDAPLTKANIRRFADGVRTGCAGSHDCHVGTAHAQTDGNGARSGICQHHGDQERAYALRAALLQCFVVVKQCADAPDARANQHPDTIPGGFVDR